MAFTALYEGEERGAWSVPRSERAVCPNCGDEMHVVSESTDGRARHFSHNPDHSAGGGGGVGRACSGGESDDHKKWKNFAAERLEELFGDRIIERASVEEPLAAPWSDKESRAADACVFFEEWDGQFGRGLAIEVQHKNTDKDKRAVEIDYGRQDVAVLWLSGDDFQDDGLRLEEVDIRVRTRAQTSICEQVDKWKVVRLSNGFPEMTHTDQPPTHEQLIYEVYDPREREASVPATIVADWVLPTPRKYWLDEGWDAAFHPTDGAYLPEYERGNQTSVPVTIPPLVDTSQLERDNRRYACAECRWKGDEYLKVEDGTVGGTAVCPNCSGGLRLNVTAARRVQRRVEGSK